MKQEYSFDSYAAANFADGEAVASNIALFRSDDNAFENLNSLFAAFNDLDMDTHGISGVEYRHRLFGLGSFNFSYQRMHF
jgi:hypothetical protein